MTTYRSENIAQRLAHIAERMELLRAELPQLEERRDWAYGNESSRVWYFASVRVNEARRELKRDEKEMAQLQRELKLIRQRRR